MDHYVLPDDDLALAQGEGRLQRNFQGYSLQLADDLLGLGVSAISQIGDFYLQNARDLDDYYRRIDAGELPLNRGCMVTSEDKLRRHVIMTLICELALDIADCEGRFGIDFREHFANELATLAPLEADGLLTLGEEEIRIHEAGRPFLRNICMPFDEYLEVQQREQGRRFSATV
jgi:oxygen-independent coproporphyrinogen-3 oxidase